MKPLLNIFGPILNIFGPIVIGAYTIAYAVSHEKLFESYTAHPYACTTLMFIIVGCIVWLSYGAATFDEY